MSNARVCTIDDEGGPVTVRLLVHNALRAGSDFRIVGEGGQEIDRWNMEAGDRGEDNHEVNATASALDRATMNWEILVCSVKPTIDSGSVSVQVLQDGAARPMTKPAQWHLEDVPDCETNEAIPIRAKLRFIGD